MSSEILILKKGDIKPQTGSPSDLILLRPADLNISVDSGTFQN